MTCTLYFNMSETRTVANSWAGAAIITALCTAAGGPSVGAVCALASGSIVAAAQYSINQNPPQCLKIRMLPPVPYPSIIGYYRYSC